MSDSAESRGNRAGVWAAGCAVLWLCACSGATDVVGVIEPDVTDVQSTLGSGRDGSSSAGSSSDTVNPAGLQDFSQNGADGSELLVVAGLPLRDYPGQTFRWPLSLRLRNFFSGPSWGRSGPPDHVERDAFERMGPFYSEQQKEDVRFVASRGDAAELLRGLFSEARQFFGVEPRSLVTRDAWSDEYLVVLGTASCDRSSSHHGDACADLGSFTGGNSNEGNSDGANSNEGNSDGASFDAP